ncbi:MAG: hypothetical protein R3E89_17220 [Thiolinea sp.]
MEESISESINFRRAMQKVDEEYGESRWFRIWGPNITSHEEGIGERDTWVLKANERWHDFGDLADNFNMLDPIKATIITPGLDVDGAFSDEIGIPAAIVTRYLAEHGALLSRSAACTASSSCSPSALQRPLEYHC